MLANIAAIYIPQYACMKYYSPTFTSVLMIQKERTELPYAQRRKGLNMNTKQHFSIAVLVFPRKKTSDQTPLNNIKPKKVRVLDRCTCIFVSYLL